MVRTPLVAFVLACLAAATAACSVTPYAASVGTTTISQDRLISEVHAYQDSPLFASTSPSGAPATTKTTKPKTIPTSVAASLLKSDIANVIVNRLLHRHGVKITPVLRAVAQKEVASSDRTGSFTKQVSKKFATYLYNQAAASIALDAYVAKLTLTSDGIRSYFEKHAADFEKVCLVDAVFATQAAAQAAAAAVRAGTSFDQATAGAQQSSGGTAKPDCAPLGPVQPSLRQTIQSTPAGQVGPIVSTGSSSAAGGPSGFAIFQVLSFQKQPYDPTQETTIASEMVQGAVTAQVQSAVSAMIKAEARSVRISVNPADGKLVVGSKQTLGFDVVAPSGPPAKVLPTTTTTQPLSSSSPHH